MPTSQASIPKFLLALLLVMPAGLVIVNSANDADDGLCNSSHCSLREAINQANSGVGPDHIGFNLGSATIAPNSPLPPAASPSAPTARSTSTAAHSPPVKAS